MLTLGETTTTAAFLKKFFFNHECYFLGTAWSTPKFHGPPFCSFFFGDQYSLWRLRLSPHPVLFPSSSPLATLLAYFWPNANLLLLLSRGILFAIRLHSRISIPIPFPHLERKFPRGSEEENNKKKKWNKKMSHKSAASKFCFIFLFFCHFLLFFSLEEK